MTIAFDPATKRIILDSDSVTATELYSRSADWLALSDNAKYGAVFRQVGGDDLGGGLSIPPYFFLQGAWRVRPMESSHNLTITGNLFVEGGGMPVVPTLGTFQVNVNYTGRSRRAAPAAARPGAGAGYFYQRQQRPERRGHRRRSAGGIAGQFHSGRRGQGQRRAARRLRRAR